MAFFSFTMSLASWRFFLAPLVINNPAVTSPTPNPVIAHSCGFLGEILPKESLSKIIPEAPTTEPLMTFKRY